MSMGRELLHKILPTQLGKFSWKVPAKINVYSKPSTLISTTLSRSEKENKVILSI